MDTPITTVPDGDYLVDGHGHRFARENLRPQLLEEHDLVEELAAEALELRGLLSLFKAKCFEAIQAHRERVAERYKARLGGTRGGLTLHNFGDTKRITISEADSLAFGSELEAAKSLIEECLQDWSAGSNANLIAVVNDAFHVGENKKVRMDRVLGLRRLNIDDARWLRAMNAINEAVRAERSKLYVRLYRRDRPEEPMDLIVLDLARVP